MKHLNAAIRQAKKSDFKQRIGAVLFRGSKILGVGYNRVGEAQNRMKTSHWSDSRHAEVDAVIDALRRYKAEELAGADMLVVRLLKNNSYGLALPCKHCYTVVSNIGVRKVWFSTNEQTFGMLRVK